MAKILLAEDDQLLRDMMAAYLNSKGHAVVSVANGQAAKAVALTGDFNVIISDVQMPQVNGVELLEWCRESSKIPFIVMTGFSNLIHTQQASDLGASAFLTKPFTNRALLDLVNEVTAPKSIADDARDTEKIENDFCKVPVDAYIINPVATSDIFARLSTARYLKVATKGDMIDVARFTLYKSKGLQYLHIKKHDHDRLYANEKPLSCALTPLALQDKKRNYIAFAEKVLRDRCYASHLPLKDVAQAKTVFLSAIEMVSANADLFQLLDRLKEHTEETCVKSVALSFYAVMMAKKMGIDSLQTNLKLVMASLFCDVGKKEIDVTTLDKVRAQWSVDERKLLESHPLRSREILESISNVPSDVIQIIFEHHEDEIGQGYPRRPQKMSLHPLSRLMFVAELFVERAIQTKKNNCTNPFAALEQMEKFDLERMNSEAFRSLKSLFAEKKVA